MYSFSYIILQVTNESYPGFIITAGIFVIVLSIYFVGQTIISRRKKNRLVMEKKLLQEQFDSQIMQNRIEVQEATFDSLGKELHDNIGQLLSTAKMLIGITERNMETPPLTLVSANETLDKAIRELRDISKSLNKDWLHQFDLYRNLAADTEKINAAGIVRITVDRDSPILPLRAEEQFIFYRLIQEGIQNVFKHAKARHLLIRISYDDQMISAMLQDDGHGFDTRQQHPGLGIKNMQERIKILKGKINWDSSPSGTRINLQFPIKKLSA